MTDLKQSSHMLFSEYTVYFLFLGKSIRFCYKRQKNASSLEMYVICSVLPRLRFCDILAKKIQMSHTKSSRCTICRVRICVGTNPKQMCSDLPDTQNNDRKMSDCLSLTRSLRFAYGLKTIYLS